VVWDGAAALSLRWSLGTSVRVLAGVGTGGRPARLLVLLGAVAGQAVFGPGFRVGEHKGKVEEAGVGPWQGRVVGTIHPSAVVRGDNPKARDALYAGLVADLATAREACQDAS
jgi:uracil-DNA glycosylase